MSKHADAIDAGTLAEILSGTPPDAPALAWTGSGTMTHRQLRAAVRRVGGQLAALGIGAGDRVALVLPNGPSMAVAFLATASCAAAAPLNPKYRAKEFRFYLADLGAKAVILDEAGNEEALAGVPPDVRVLTLRGTPQEPELAVAGDAPPEARQAPARPDDVALVLHTSGTTSRPKIVPLRQRNLAASARHIAAGLSLTEGDRCLNVMPLFHIHGLVAGLLAPLSAGGSVMCPPGFDAFRFFDWLDAYAPTWYTAVPTMHELVLARAPRHRDVLERTPLRFVRSSSASLPVPLLERLVALFGVPVIEAYGMTEATHQMASNPLPPGVQKPGSVGRPTGIELTVMTEDGRRAGSGEVGEVVIRGGTVIDGYENNPGANADAFREGWFRTGDQGYLDEDGYLFLTGRLKEIINRGGEKVSPLEVDEVLLAHPGVREAVTFGLPHPKLGEEVAAAVVLREGSGVTDREIRQFAAERLAEFKVPRTIVVVPEIPKGPTGKVQRLSLAGALGLSERQAPR